MSMTAISEKKFRRILQAKMNGSWERALAVFRGFDRKVSLDVAHALYHASNLGKTDRVLDLLERHLKERSRMRIAGKKRAARNNEGDKLLFSIISRDVLGFNREPMP